MSDIGESHGMVPCAKLSLDGEPGALITAIDNRSGWNAIWDVMGALDDTLSEDVGCWRIELVMMSRSELDALPEHTGW